MRRILGRLRRAVATRLGRVSAVPSGADDRFSRLPGLVDDPLAGHARVAVLADGDIDEVLGDLRSVAPDAQVQVLRPGTPAGLHVELAVSAPYDVIIDAGTGPLAERSARARAVLLHLRPGGALVALDAAAPAADPSTDSETPPDDFLSLLTVAFAAALRPSATKSRKVDDERALVRAVGSVSVRGADLMIVNQLPARAKIREEQAGRFLELAGPTVGRVLHERPGSVVENPAPVRESEADGSPEIVTRLEAPPLQLREYLDVVCRPGQVVTREKVLLPETYRHLARKRLGNKFIEDVAPAFGRLTDKRPPEPLAGTYFHLDSEFRGHFGHAMTEQISRLWAWEEAKRHTPELKALLLTNKKRTTIFDWERRLYQAAGVDPDDLVLADGAVRVERLYGATPMFSQPEFIHADAAALYRRMGDDLAAEAPQRDYPRRFFCSRRNTKRSCHNTAEVEEFFAARGFEIVYPEDYPMSEQVQMFRSAEEVAGFGGSAMFTMAFAPEPKRVTLVSSENYWAQNEFVIAAVIGHQVNVAWCRPDKPRSQGHTGEAALQSQYTFDPEREGRFLQDVLDG
jgi:capsular polysaccharide biosynthesis protein